jgi:hypothetical protein
MSALDVLMSRDPIWVMLFAVLNSLSCFSNWISIYIQTEYTAFVNATKLKTIINGTSLIL